jgi:hypothetical protein
MVINEIFLRAFQIIISIKIEIAKAIDKLIFIFCPRRGLVNPPRRGGGSGSKGEKYDLSLPSKN